jgi:superfamily I DNA/RNA helicase
MDHGLNIYGSWEQLTIREDIKLYMKRLLESGDDLFSEPRIKVSTIHGVKGEECDNVGLFVDIPKVAYDEAKRNPNPEQRVFFVGVTRTKENLYIMRPTTNEYFITIGAPIV